MLRKMINNYQTNVPVWKDPYPCCFYVFSNKSDSIFPITDKEIGKLI